jgi:hypothetical protein
MSVEIGSEAAQFHFWDYLFFRIFGTVQSITVFVPLSEFGPLHPLPRKRVWPLPPPVTKGGTHSSVGEGVGGSQFGRLEKKPSTLSALCKEESRKSYR